MAKKYPPLYIEGAYYWHPEKDFICTGTLKSGYYYSVEFSSIYTKTSTKKGKNIDDISITFNDQTYSLNDEESYKIIAMEELECITDFSNITAYDLNRLES